MKYLYITLLLINLACKADISLIVSKNSNISNIEKSVIADIFMGRNYYAEDNKMFIPINNSILIDQFYISVENKDKFAMETYWDRKMFTSRGEPPAVVNSDSEILSIVSSNPSIIGYVDPNSIKPDSNVVVVYTIKDTDTP